MLGLADGEHDLGDGEVVGHVDDLKKVSSNEGVAHCKALRLINDLAAKKKKNH